jgi:hypothetical protein
VMSGGSSKIRFGRALIRRRASATDWSTNDVSVSRESWLASSAIQGIE